MSFWEYYLVIINSIGFLLFLINTWLYSYTRTGQVDKFLTVVSLLGGALGIVISILIFDRKAVKGNMMSRVFVICVLVVQIIIFLMLRGVHGEEISFAFISFFERNKALLIYLLAINIITFVVFAVDKYAAINGMWRTRITTLLTLCFIGGSIGGLGSMYLFNHKTSKDYFTVGIPLIIVMQIVLIFFIMNL